MTLVSLLAGTLRSPALRTTLVFGCAGVGFAAGNLILARALPTLEYAIFALVLTFLNIGIPLAPLGADLVVNRRGVARDQNLLLRALATSVAVAVLATWTAARWYSVEPHLLWWIGIAVTAGGANYVAAAHFQSRREFRISLPLAQGINFVILGAALLTWLLSLQSIEFAVSLIASSYVALALLGWRPLLRGPSAGSQEREPFRWSEALSCVGVSGVAILLGQLERLVIPQFLTLEALATFGVLAAIVGSVFRMLWLGVGFALLPRMRQAADVSSRRRLLFQELRTVCGVMTLACIGLWLVTPWLVEWALAGKYTLSPALILAALVSGVLKVGSAFARATATALADNRQIAYLNALGWFAVTLALCGAALGAHWGLPGVLYGVSLGWLSQGVFAALVAAPHLRQPREATVLAVGR